MTETAKYTITGLVDIFDEQGLITGQYPVGSVQELTLARGDAAVEAGQAELFVEGAAEDADTAPTGETGEEAPTGETGEDAEVESDEDEDDELGETGESEVE